MTDLTENEDTGIDRRTVLKSAAAASVAGFVGVPAFSGTAAAWDEFNVCFRGCSEVWMIVDWVDIGADPPLVAYVIVESNGEAECRTVEFTEANATTIPGKFGDSAVVKYAPGGDDKILGVVEHDYGDLDGPAWCVTVNENNCADTPNTPDVWDASCITEDHKECPGGDYCGGTGGGGSSKNRGNKP